MSALFKHVFPAWKARIEKMASKQDFSELRFLVREL